MNWRVFLAFAFGSSVLAGDGFKPIFNGKTLDGWDGDPRLWKVRDGMIVGSTEGVPIQNNTFLISRRTYSDFILKAQVKLRNHNSGIQFRSEALPGWIVRGYQADMAENNYWGSLYDERGKRGILADGWKGKAETVVKLAEWNDYEIRCQGDRIQVFLNGRETADLRDSERLEGVLAFQLHKGPPMEAYFREVKIKVLKAARQRPGPGESKD